MSVMLGQHIGDDMISFCMRSPGGFDLEYVRGERLVVDNAAWAPRLFNVAAGARREMWEQARHLPQSTRFTKGM
jgi:hypothetical protein